MERQKSVTYFKILRCFQLDETEILTRLLPIIEEETDSNFVVYANDYECGLRITSEKSTYEEAKTECNNMIHKVKGLIGDYIYSEDDEELPDVVGKLLIEKNLTISSCESCTGGMFASMLTEVSGISKVFNRGLVTYAYEAKEQELGVKKETLSQFTAESPQVALEMVEGLKKVSGSDICISITGIAGPDDMSPEKPAGLAYIGLSYEGKTNVITTKHKNISRHGNRKYMTLKMFYEIFKLIR